MVYARMHSRTVALRWKGTRRRCVRTDEVVSGLLAVIRNSSGADITTLRYKWSLRKCGCYWLEWSSSRGAFRGVHWVQSITLLMYAVVLWRILWLQDKTVYIVRVLVSK